MHTHRNIQVKVDSVPAILFNKNILKKKKNMEKLSSICVLKLNILLTMIRVENLSLLVINFYARSDD